MSLNEIYCDTDYQCLGTSGVLSQRYGLYDPERADGCGGGILQCYENWIKHEIELNVKNVWSEIIP